MRERERGGRGEEDGQGMESGERRGREERKRGGEGGDEEEEGKE